MTDNNSTKQIVDRKTFEEVVSKNIHKTPISNFQHSNFIGFIDRLSNEVSKVHWIGSDIWLWPILILKFLRKRKTFGYDVNDRYQEGIWGIYYQYKKYAKFDIYTELPLIISDNLFLTNKYLYFKTRRDGTGKVDLTKIKEVEMRDYSRLSNSFDLYINGERVCIVMGLNGSTGDNLQKLFWGINGSLGYFFHGENPDG